MDRTPVVSSALKSIGHDGIDLLEVELANGKIYRYQGVSAEAHAALMGADSIGRHFGQHIRGKFAPAAPQDE